MTLVRELADAVHAVAVVINDTRDLAEAVQDGRKFLAREHPEAKEDLTEMLSQMQTTVEGLANVMSVATGFRFTTSGAAVDFETVRFNEHVIKQKKEVDALKGDIRRLKGSSGKIRDARDKLNQLGGDRNDWLAMFRLFGKQQRQMNARLARSLSQFYADDQRMIALIREILDLSQRALTEADQVLGPMRTASPENVERAAAVLSDYAGAFEKSKADLDALVETLADAIDSLK